MAALVVATSGRVIMVTQRPHPHTLAAARLAGLVTTIHLPEDTARKATAVLPSSNHPPTVFHTLAATLVLVLRLTAVSHLHIAVTRAAAWTGGVSNLLLSFLHHLLPNLLVVICRSELLRYLLPRPVLFFTPIGFALFLSPLTVSVTLPS